MGPDDAESLVVLRRTRTQVYDAPVRDKLHREQVAAIFISVIRSDRIDLVFVVALGLERAPAATAARLQRHDQDVTFAAGPLALDPQQLRAQVEDEVVSEVLGNGPENTDPALGGGGGYGRLRNRTLAIRAVHELMFACDADATRPENRFVKGFLQSRRCFVTQPTERAGASPQSCSRR